MSLNSEVSQYLSLANTLTTCVEFFMFYGNLLSNPKKFYINDIHFRPPRKPFDISCRLKALSHDLKMLSPCIMSVQYIGGCSVHGRDTMSTSRDIMIHVGKQIDKSL